MEREGIYCLAMDDCLAVLSKRGQAVIVTITKDSTLVEGDGFSVRYANPAFWEHWIGRLGGVLREELSWM